MKKKLTKLSALVLAVVVTVTASVLPATASDGGIVEPEILFYRDYEDYAGGDPLNYGAAGVNAYGTWSVSGDGTWATYTAADSIDGKGFYVTAGNYNNGYDLFPDMNDGILHIAFDEIPGGSPFETSVYFRGGSTKFAFSYQPGVAWTEADLNWGFNMPDYMLGSGKNHRIDLIIDPATGDAKRYINGNYIGTKNIGITTGLTELYMRFSATSVIDNLTVVYYPENLNVQQNFSVESAAVNNDDTFSVFLKGIATDRDGKGMDVKSSITASYPVILADDALTADAFSIEGLNVTSVTRGTSAGEYKIAVSEEITPGTNYTITAKSSLTDAFGAIINESAKSATAMKIPESETVPEPEVLFYRDFEDYTGGDPLNQDAAENAYGTWGIAGDGTWDAYTAADSASGKGFYVSNGHYSGNPAGLPDMNTGTLYVAFDEIPGAAPDQTSVYFKSGTPNFAFSYQPGVAWTEADLNWGYGNTMHMLGSGQNHKIELIIDPATGDAKRYVNGNYIGTKNIGITTGLTEMLFRFSATSVIDNLTVVYFPEDFQQTFSLSKVEADEKADVFRVFLTSDTVDSDGKGWTTKSEIAAPYGITLPTADTTGVNYILADDTFSVEGMNVTSVTRGTRPGEYIIAVDGDVKAEESYTVSAREDIVDILGSSLNLGATSKLVDVAPKFEVAEVEVSGGIPTVKFNDDIINPAEYSKGVTVKNVYTGETGTATLTKAASNKATIGGYEFVIGDEYEVTLPAALRGKKGNSLSDNTVMFNLATINSLEKISLVNVQGGKHDLAQVNPVGLESIDFKFTADVNAANVTISIKDENNTPFTDYISVSGGNTTSLKLNKILAPGKTYTISVSGLAKAYAITLKTEDAKLDRLPVIFLDEEGNALESIAVGDSVKVRMDFVNSTNEEKSFIAAASMFSGLELTDFKHKEITMKPVSDGGTGKRTETFTFTVLKTNGGVKLKGHMWSEADGKLAPITPSESFE